MFTIGLMLRIFAVAPQCGHLADLSIAIAILGHLFLYLRSLLPFYAQVPVFYSNRPVLQVYESAARSAKTQNVM